MAKEPLSIKVFLPKGGPDQLRTAEISNWTGKLVASSRDELKELVDRPEVRQPGIYVLLGSDPDTGDATAYIGEAEVVSQRLKQHLGRDDWNQVVVLVSKDETLTKSHIKYLEGLLISRAIAAGRATVLNNQSSGAKLPEADQAEMDVFVKKALQVFPIIGVNVFKVPVKEDLKGTAKLKCTIKGLTAWGQRTPAGFVVFAGSQAVLEARPSGFRAKAQRHELVKKGVLKNNGDHLVFTKDYEFTSPSIAGRVIRGGATNGLKAWKTENGITLKELEGMSK